MEKREPNPYILAFFTALLAAAFSIYGSYLTNKHQIEQTILNKTLEERNKAYREFLRNSKFSENTNIGKLANLYPMLYYATSDAASMKYFKDLEKLAAEQLYLLVANDLITLSVFGSKELKKYVMI